MTATVKVPSIYAIKCLPESKYYIGCSNSLTRRRLDHYSVLQSGKHTSVGLQEAFYRHGIESLRWTRLFSPPHPMRANNLERRLIEYLKPKAILYNAYPIYCHVEPYCRDTYEALAVCLFRIDSNEYEQLIPKSSKLVRAINAK